MGEASRKAKTKMPRWVKLSHFAMLGIALILLFLIFGGVTKDHLHHFALLASIPRAAQT